MIQQQPMPHQEQRLLHRLLEKFRLPLRLPQQQQQQQQLEDEATQWMIAFGTL